MQRQPSTVQQEMLDFCRDHTVHHLRFPTMRTIQENCGLSSTSVVQYNLDALVKQGFITRVVRGTTTIYCFPEMRGSLESLVQSADTVLEQTSAESWDDHANRELFETLRRTVSDAKFVWQIT